MPWLDKVGAVLEAWYPGNRGANAIASVLFGAVNPSGRLPITFPQSESQLPRPVIPGRAHASAALPLEGTQHAVRHRLHSKARMSDTNGSKRRS